MRGLTQDELITTLIENVWTAEEERQDGLPPTGYPSSGGFCCLISSAVPENLLAYFTPFRPDTPLGYEDALPVQTSWAGTTAGTSYANARRQCR
jgi:hypothetical protein